MAARIVRLVTVPERVRLEAGRAAVSAVMGLPDAALSPHERTVLLRAVQRATEAPRGAVEWPGGFAMISLHQIEAVWSWIRALPARDRPGRVRHAFDLVLTNLQPDTGLVLLRRDEFAERMGCKPDEVSAAMGVLVRGGVLSAERQRVDGLRGPGVVVWKINPHVAWNGRLDERRSAAKDRKPPLLRLMEGEARDG